MVIEMSSVAAIGGAGGGGGGVVQVAHSETLSGS